MPSETLGPYGWVTHHHPSLQSLSLTTDPRCNDGECEIDLSPLRRLQNLTWRGARAEDIPTLSVAIRKNSPWLQTIKLDLVSWLALRQVMGLKDRYDDPELWFPHNLFGLASGPRTVTFAAIRELSLSQVPLTTSMAQAINFNTLASLRLRECPSWDTFLESAMVFKSVIKLKTLELQYSEDVAEDVGYVVVEAFLGSFEGLEELFLGSLVPENTLELWNLITHQQATLRIFVHHRRTVGFDDWSFHFGYKIDLPDLGISSPQSLVVGGLSPEDREIHPQAPHLGGETPFQNPLARLSLDFIGLCCAPDLLVREPITRDFQTRSSVLSTTLGRKIFCYRLRRRVR